MHAPPALTNISHDQAPKSPMYLTRRFLLVLAVLAATSPLLAAWSHADGAAWYRPQLLWLGIIAAISLAMYRDTRDGN